MKKVIQIAKGQPTSSSIVFFNEDAEKPSIKNPTDVLIKVKSVSINPVDYKIITGNVPDKVALPHGIGSDFSGIVEEVGDGVTKFKSGDEIYGDLLWNDVMQEYCVGPERLISLKPKNMSFEEAAGIPLSGVTALQALRDHGKIESGMKVCIFGGSGGVGMKAIQIAKTLGASQITTTSTNEELCLSLGADKVINYRNDDVGEILKGQNFDLVFDCVGGKDYWNAGQKILARKGQYVSVSGDNVPMYLMMPRFIYRKILATVGLGHKYHAFRAEQNSADIETLTKMIEEGNLTAIVDGPVVPFTQAGVKTMFERIMSGRTKGKLAMNLS